MISAPSSCSWDALMEWGSKLKRKSLRNTVAKLSWQASVYHIWRERNSRIHSQKSGSPDSVCDLIFQDLRLKIISFPNSTAIDPHTAQVLGLPSST